MRIKHWQGYGTVEAKRISKRHANGLQKIHIQVKGNHEWGLVREDKYDVSRWLLKRFDKSFAGNPYTDIKELIVNSSYETDRNGISTEVCDYYISYVV